MKKTIYTMGALSALMLFQSPEAVFAQDVAKVDIKPIITELQVKKDLSTDLLPLSILGKSKIKSTVMQSPVKPRITIKKESLVKEVQLPEYIANIWESIEDKSIGVFNLKEDSTDSAIKESDKLHFIDDKATVIEKVFIPVVKLELGTEDVTEVVEIKDVDVDIDSIEISNSEIIQEVGWQFVTITSSSKSGKETSLNVLVELADNEAPELVFDNPTIKEGESIDLSSIIEVVDASDVKLKVDNESFDGLKSPKLKESLSIMVTAEDAHGNVTDEKLTINVTPKPEPKPEPATVSNSSVAQSRASSTSTSNTYTAGWCTWHAADKRAAAGKPIPNNLGNAETWGSRLQSQGYSLSSTPTVGAVVIFPSSQNHVAYVESIDSNGNPVISEMGWGMQAWGYNTRTISASSARYLN